MQGLDLGSQHDSNYSPMEVGADLDFDHLDELPQPPQDNNQVAAWYDTDL
jgi:catenin beta 1